MKTQIIYQLTPEAFDMLVARASEALLLDEPENLMPPIPTEEVAATNRIAALHLKRIENRKMLVQYLNQKNDLEIKLRNSDPKIKALHNTLQKTQKEYNTLLAENLSNTLVPDRIAQYTQNLEDLSKQLRKLEELQ